ncbi:MAG: hypothetical protein WC899_00900 [bacterium]|jgi:hypothetical protein
MGQGNGDRGKGSYKRLDEYVEYAVSNSDHASELIARSFYKILRKNGFSDKQIINTANNLLDCLIKSLEGYKEKIGVPSDDETDEIDLRVIE